ncbi:isochorismatase [Acinetobacter sp. ANC 5054]|uniref:phosphopantetheine-binding protein n=1 Tax=Acinetobacter sp. ANC 5054 TaxID=1977877 RepID=UPI000A3406EE|nr:phosphopantetheine-binding protein [Acinetobacter sp. ANC 5054]OTG82750.1 isochorismatase [Acinetobacter sp. ANC 5054]
MLYPMPKKIQFAPSLSKWQLSSTQSVLVLVGLQNLRAQQGMQETALMENLIQLSNKAKALEIPVVDLLQGMQQLGEYATSHPQLIFAGQITPMLRQILPHLNSVTEQICVVDDAILLANQEQHIQWVDSLTTQGFHHMNSYSVTRLWSLSAPTEYVLSAKGILLAVAEQLDMEALEIDPLQDLRGYGLDSVAMVSLVGLWRANGANIRYEDLLDNPNLNSLLKILLNSD